VPEVLLSAPAVPPVRRKYTLSLKLLAANPPVGHAAALKKRIRVSPI
jgi:hypothetical protein